MQSEILDLINPLQGTDSQEDFSRGNTLPLICTPFPMTAWTLQSSEGRWMYGWNSPKIQGIRATHQPSPWVGDHGQFTLMPQTGERALDAASRASSYDKQSLVVRPNYLRAKLLRYNCVVEITPTERCARFRCKFNTRQARFIIDCFRQGGSLEWSEETQSVHGCSRANSSGVPGNFGQWFVIRFNVPLRNFFVADPGPAHETGEHPALLGAAEFELPPNGEVECVVATSYISIEQAHANLHREIGSSSFEETRERTGKLWIEKMSSVEIDTGNKAAKATFYSCLYRALTFPQKMHETDANGSLIHYSPYSGRVEQGVLYTGHGFWDACRTTYPLYAMLFPEDYSDMLRGWLNAYREGGWFPRWPSPGYRPCMLSTHIDVVFADAVVKGITGFDLAEAYEGLRKHAFEEPAKDLGYGRPGLLEYIRLGYVPDDRFHHSVASTLDNAYGDFCLSQIASRLGRNEDAAIFQARSLSYKHLFDSSTGFMRPKKSDGSWLEPFDPFLWGGPYVEGGAWQTSWGVPHDIPGLISLHGGASKFLQKLDEMLATPPLFHVGDYGFEIHEMTEMAVAPFGQYAHSNQPVHHVLYLFAQAGAPEKTNYWVRRILNEYYDNSVGGFPGDEDNGEMSAWYILSALGLFPICPGKADYTLTSPFFSSARVRLGNGSRLLIQNSSLTAAETSMPGEFLFNGKPIRAIHLSHAELQGGGELLYRAEE